MLGEHLLGWEHVGAVEMNNWRRGLLGKRFPKMPLLVDVRGVPQQKALFGKVDVITAGFPCQPFSSAGVRLGQEDPRNGWPWTYDSLSAIRPKYALLENVPGLLKAPVRGYFGQILMDLMSLGYSARWMVLSAADVGAHHFRNRLWVRCEKNKTLKRGNNKVFAVVEEGKLIRQQDLHNRLSADLLGIENCVNEAWDFPLSGAACKGVVWSEGSQTLPTRNVDHYFYVTPCKSDGISFLTDDAERYFETLPRLMYRRFSHSASALDADALNLNPDWVEAFMGWAIGWTNPEASVDLNKWQEEIPRLWKMKDALTDWTVPPVAPLVKGATHNRIAALGDGQVPQCVKAAWETLASPIKSVLTEEDIGHRVNVGLNPEASQTEPDEDLPYEGLW